MQFLHGYQLALGDPEVKKVKANIAPEVLEAAEKFSKDIKAAKNGGEAGKVFDALVASQNIADSTMNKTFGEVFRGIPDENNTESQKLGFIIATLTVATEKTPEIVKKGATKPEEMKNLAGKPLKAFFAFLRSKIVESKGGSAEGWSTTKKILVFGGGAIALGGLFYFVTQTKTSRKR